MPKFEQNPTEYRKDKADKLKEVRGLDKDLAQEYLTTIQGTEEYQNARDEKIKEKKIDDVRKEIVGIKDQEEIKEAQRLVEKLTAELDTLNFSDNSKVLDWCLKMQDPSDRRGVKAPREEIIKKFAEHGIVPGMYVGRKDLINNEDAYAKFIIGQAISGIQKDGSVSQVIYGAVDRWKEDFATEKV